MAGKVWTDEVCAELVRLWNSSAHIDAIAGALGEMTGREVSRGALYNRISKLRRAGHELRERRGGPLSGSGPLIERIRPLAREGKSPAEIAEALNSTAHYVRNCARRHGLEFRHRRRRRVSPLPEEPGALVAPADGDGPRGASGGPTSDAVKMPPSFRSGGTPGIDDGPEADVRGRRSDPRFRGDRRQRPARPKVTLVASVATGETYPHEVRDESVALLARVYG